MSDPDLFSSFIRFYFALINDMHFFVMEWKKIFTKESRARLATHGAVAAATHEWEKEPPGDESQSQDFCHMEGHHVS